MIRFVDDMSANVALDSSLMGESLSGIYYNQGVNPLVTIGNIIASLPRNNIVYGDYNVAETYTSEFKRSNIVISNSKLYQSIVDNNTGNEVSDTNYWLETNDESIKIKDFISKSRQNALNDINLTRRLLENQYIYNYGENDFEITSDYAGWAFEPKGSDYVSIRINQICLRAKTTDPTNLYVVNQGRLLETIVLNPQNGVLAFESINKTYLGKGPFYFLFDKTTVVSDQVWNDPLKYDSLVAYPVTASGTTPQDADIADSSNGNGLSFNVTTFLNSTDYIAMNEIDFSTFIQKRFELDVMNLFLFNAGNTQNDAIRNILEHLPDIREQVVNKQDETVIAQYLRVKRQLRDSIERTFDRFLKPQQRSKFTFKVGSI